MNTIDRLQKHLATEPVNTPTGLAYKVPVDLVKCADGTTLSVQASEYHYCTPRNNKGPYKKVEVWCVSSEVTEFEYSEENPSAYVPIEDVVRFIDNHGGMTN